MNNMIDKATCLLESNSRIRKAVESACLISNVSIKEFDSGCRERHIVDCKRMVYSFCKEELKLGWSVISKYFKVNHATVIHHYKSHNQIIEFDKYYEKKYDSFCELVKADIGFVDIESIIKQVKEIKREAILKQSSIKNSEEIEKDTCQEK